MAVEERVLIAGAGPVGLVAAANLVRGGVPVTVLEAGSGLSEESRASTFHPPTLDMLDRLGAAQALIAQGMKAPQFQYRSKQHGVLAQFDFDAIADVTGHPYRVQAEQSKLTRILLDQLQGQNDFELQLDAQVKGVSQTPSGVEVTVERNGRTETRSGRYLVGADGASSSVRRSLGIAFDGFTWPERFLVVSTPFDFAPVIPGLVAVSYVTDPKRWHFLLQIPGLCRVMFPVAADETDALALSGEFAQSLMATVVPGHQNYEIAHLTLYKVHQRVAKTFQQGRAFLMGDAAHINNPLGGMGMNGGIQDAFNLADKLRAIWAGADDRLLDRYDRQRRTVAVEAVQQQTHRNQQIISERDPTTRQKALEAMRKTAADKTSAREYMLRSSMIASMRRAAQIA